MVCAKEHGKTNQGVAHPAFSACAFDASRPRCGRGSKGRNGHPYRDGLFGLSTQAAKSTNPIQSESASSRCAICIQTGASSSRLMAPARVAPASESERRPRALSPPGAVSIAEQSPTQQRNSSRRESPAPDAGRAAEAGNWLRPKNPDENPAPATSPETRCRPAPRSRPRR
jgi:hypothetical protein